MRRSLALFAVCVLAACSSGEEPAHEDTATPSAVEETAEAASEGRPSEDDYRQGLNPDVLADAGISIDSVSTDSLDDYFTCVAESSYDAVSDGWVRGIANSDISQAVTESNGNDLTLFANSATQCIDQIATSTWTN